ncbi:hypothetical protein M5585_20775 [Serratia ureilytica]
MALRAIAPPGKHSLKERLAPLRQKAVLTTLLITFFAVCSEHIVYSYVSVLLKTPSSARRRSCPSRCWCSALAR